MNKKMIWIVAAVAIFGFFYFLIPETIVHSSRFFWGFVGSGLTAACIFLAGYKKPDEMYNIDTYKKNNGKQSAAIILGVFVLIGGAIALYFKYCSRIEAFIEANPVISIGTVVDGKSTTTKRRGTSSTSYELNVNYKDSNGVQYKTDANVSSDEWDKAGKGMPITVVYQKDNPSVCKVLMNTKEAMKYVPKNKRLYPSIKDLQAFLRTDDYNEQKKLLGDFWSANKMEDTEDGVEFSNSISKDNMGIMSLGNIYINEDENDVSFKAILQEAKATMKVVYDSMATNKVKGILLENDSMQIRFQEYTRSVQKQSGGEYNFSFPQLKRVFCFAFNKKNKFMILPGDLKGLEGEEEEKTNAISPADLQELIINSKKK